MRILYVTPEVYPLVKTGGLADVAGSLPKALRVLGYDVRLLVPGYPGVISGVADLRPVAEVADLPGAVSGRLLFGSSPGGVPTYVLDAPALFDRPGNPYLDRNGRDWPDNHLRFGAFCWAAAALGRGGLDPAWSADVVHCQDWQSGLAPAYLALGDGPRPATVMTIHNIAYQGLFPASTLSELKLPPESFSMYGVEYYGHVGFLKAGLYYADRISTVSPTYAREIQTPAEGRGLHGLLAGRAADVWGIINGVDTTVWDPANDAAIVARYDAASLERKALNTQALENEFGLRHDAHVPLFGCVTRLTPDKGLDLLAGAVPRLVELGARLVLLGSGASDLELAFREAAAAFPESVGVRIGYDEGLAHRIQAGADVILVPSRSEPCGLTQLYGLRYGTLPLVQRVGGLADTVVDATEPNLADGTATGFVFAEATVPALVHALERAAALFTDQARWRKLQQYAMSRDFSWTASAKRYGELYRSAIPASRMVA